MATGGKVEVGVGDKVGDAIRLGVALGAGRVRVGVGEEVAVPVGTDTSGEVVSPACASATAGVGVLVPAAPAGSVIFAVWVVDGRASMVGVGSGWWADEKIR